MNKSSESMTKEKTKIKTGKKHKKCVKTDTVLKRNQNPLKKRDSDAEILKDSKCLNKKSRKLPSKLKAPPLDPCTYKEAISHLKGSAYDYA